MRILVIHPGPDFSVHDLGVYAGWVFALKQLGCQVFEYNLNDRLLANFLQHGDDRQW